MKEIRRLQIAASGLEIRLEDEKILKDGQTKIFVRCPNWVGDVVMATPVFECLRKNFPSAHIAAGIRKYAAGVIEDSPFFDSVTYCDDRGAGDFFRLVREIRSSSFGKAVLLTNSARGFLSSFLAGIPEIYGYRRNIQKYFVQAGPFPEIGSDGRIRAIPMTDYYLGVCKAMGLEIPGKAVPRLYFRPELADEAAGLFRKYGISDGDFVAGINPGAKFGSSKCWPPEYFARLADLITERLGAKVLVFAGPGEDEIAAKIKALSGKGVVDTAPDRINLSLLKAMIGRCNLLVTNDTGPRHYATALGVPAVVLSGSTDPEYTRYGMDITVFVRKDIPCSPCHEKICPRGNHECMRTIAPEEVLEAALKILRK